MTTDLHALITKMAAELDRCQQLLLDDRRQRHPLADHARAVLARWGNHPGSPDSSDGPAVPDGREPASVAMQPSDEEIMGLMPQQMHDDLAAAVRAMTEQEGIDSTPAKGVLRIILNRHVVDLVRAALARWGRQSAPPTEGEVGELVREMRRICFDVAPCDADTIYRASALLQQLSAAAPAVAPIPVSERLPGDQLCWWYEPDEDDDGSGYGGNWTLLRIRGGVSYYTHWLPFTALPLPAFWDGDCDKTSTSDEQ